MDAAAGLLRADRRDRRAARRDGPGAARGVLARFLLRSGRKAAHRCSRSAPTPRRRQLEPEVHPPSRAGEDRAVLALAGRLWDFDVGAAAQPALYGSMPATLFPSPGTAVGTTLLWVTPAQFTEARLDRAQLPAGQAADALRGRRRGCRVRRGPRLCLALRRLLPGGAAARHGGSFRPAGGAPRRAPRSSCSTPPPCWRSGPRPARRRSSGRSSRTSSRSWARSRPRCAEPPRPSSRTAGPPFSRAGT